MYSVSRLLPQLRLASSKLRLIVKLLPAILALLNGSLPTRAVGADELVVTVDVSGTGEGNVSTAISDKCEVHLTGRAVFRPDPATGHYKEAAEEQYTLTASGGGHILDIESWTYSERSVPKGTVSVNYMPSQGKATIGWSYLNDLILSTPEAGQGSERLARTAIKMAEDNYSMQEGSGMVQFQPNAAEFNASGQGEASYSDPLAQGKVTARFTLSRGGDGKVEAVILPPRSYDAWIPKAGPDHVFPGTLPVEVRAELRMAGTTAPPPVRKAKFRFELVETSKEPGICMNHPTKDQALDYFDLGFATPGGFTPPNQAQSLETERFTTDAIAVVLCYDYGAYGKVRVKAILDTGEEIEAFVEGNPEQKTITLPKDENNNHIADSWEKEEGTFGQAQDPAWDEADEPNDHEANGDGISLYEKYRGFQFGETHERLKARKKHLFVYDPDNLVRLNLESLMSFENASKLRVRFVQPDTWTGPGPAGSDKRIVNFNTSGFGHATDQHAVHVRVVQSPSPAVPADFQEMWVAKYGSSLKYDISAFYGFAYHDVTGGNWPDGPRSTFVIELYPPSLANICRYYVRYHTAALPLFANYSSAPPDEKAWLNTEWRRLADEYILSHPGEWGAQNHFYLMAGVSHEMGHGVGIDDLLSPNTGGPWTCYMRYLDDDCPKDVTDRMELKARWNNDAIRPQEFCQSAADTKEGKGCYKQIHVTDRQGKASLLTLHPRDVSPEIETAALNATVPLASRSLQSFATATAPSFQVTTDVVWEPVLAGDPLRIVVRLNAPSATEAWTQALHQEQHNGPPTLPAIASGWWNGLRLELFRLGTNGARTSVLAPDRWAAYSRTVSDPSTGIEQRLGSWTREFLTDPAVSGLEPGNYTLRVQWDGHGLATLAAPASGSATTGTEIAFRVAAAADDVTRARHLERLAFQAWDQKRWESARDLAQQATLLTPGAADPEAVDNQFVLASASVGLKDYLGAAKSLTTFALSSAGRVTPEVQRQARFLLDALVPSVEVQQPPSAAAGSRLLIRGHAGQTYELQVSPDLRAWTTADRRSSSVMPYVVDDKTVSGEPGKRFYRVLWLPQ